MYANAVAECQLVLPGMHELMDALLVLCLAWLLACYYILYLDSGEEKTLPEKGVVCSQVTLERAREGMQC